MFEMLISALMITTLCIIMLFLFFKSEVIWWEVLILLAISLLVGATFKWIATMGNSNDTEYWSTRFERVEHYEPWDEYIYQTCTREYACGTDSDGNTEYCTEIYDCSYVESHSRYFRKVDHLGYSYSINKSEYNRLKRKMGNSSFKDMHRDYHSYDGDMYYTTWNKVMEDYECITTTHTYTNKTQSVPNVFNFVEVDSFDIATYELYEYPTASGMSRYYQKNILGISDPIAEHRLQIVNAEIGNKKQVKIFILIFRNKSMEAKNLQEAYWKGGNKNEVVIPINIDDTGKPTWCIPFSWSEKEGFKIDIRNFVLEQEKLDLISIINFSEKKILENYERKEFADFEYLEVPLTTSQMIWGIVVSVIVNILVSIFIIGNNIRDGYNDRGYYMRR